MIGAGVDRILLVKEWWILTKNKLKLKLLKQFVEYKKDRPPEVARLKTQVKFSTQIYAIRQKYNLSFGRREPLLHNESCWKMRRIPLVRIYLMEPVKKKASTVRPR